MKWLIYGHRGWIGQQVVNYLKNNKSNDEIILGQARLENLDALDKEIKEYRKVPTCVLSFTGRTHGGKHTTIDYLEEKGNLKINLRDNLYGPINLATVCNKYAIHYTYLGTGCIYKYDDEHSFGNGNGFTEEDEPNFTGSGYSTVKGYTDRLLRNYNNVLNLRIRMPITGESNKRNFITKITNYDKVVNIPNSMSVLPELIPIMIHMAEHNETGTYNFTNPGLISHNEILEMYRELVNPEFKWTNFTEEEQNEILLAERSNNHLDTSKLEEYCKEYNLGLLEIKSSVRKILGNFVIDKK